MSVDTKARNPTASTHLLRWVHPSGRGWNSFCIGLFLIIGVLGDIIVKMLAQRFISYAS